MGIYFFLHHNVAYNESHWREVSVAELIAKCPCKKGTSRGLHLSEVLQDGIGGKQEARHSPCSSIGWELIMRLCLSSLNIFQE